MIGSPDLLAFTTNFREMSTDPFALPEELSVPLYPPSGETSPWSKISTVKFDQDFILISEFSEQVGPQPLLTIPDKTKACGLFDLNDFSLRIMSVDYQTSFTSPGDSGCPKLNFVEDSKVVLSDSREGAYAYVHHLTLYDLEARGFVRPFCIAYVSSEEQKIMQNFSQLSDEFSKASECLKTGNRKNFANELDRKLRDLEYTRLVLLREISRESLSNLSGRENHEGTKDEGSVWQKEMGKEKGNSGLLLTREEEKLEEKLKGKVSCGWSVEEESKCVSWSNKGKIKSDSSSGMLNNVGEGRHTNRSESGVEFKQLKETGEDQSVRCHSVLWANKHAELASIEKAIQDNKSLLKQVTFYPTRKLKDQEFLPYELDDDASLNLDLGLDPSVLHSEVPDPDMESNIFSNTCSQTPQLLSMNLCQRFDKHLKNLEELCDEYFLCQAMKQLRSIERNFRGDLSYLFTHHLTQNLLQHLGSTNFLFEGPCDLEREVDQQPELRSPLLHHLPTLLPPPLQSEPESLDSYASCVEMVPIKLEVSRNGQFTTEPDSGPSLCDPSLSPESPVGGNREDEEVASVPRKDSVSSGESIEVLGTEKSFKTHGPPVTMEAVLQRPLLFPSNILEGWRRRVAAHRTNSEDSIEVLSATDSIILDDLRASCPSAIHEESSEERQKQNREPSQEEKASEEHTDNAEDMVLAEEQEHQYISGTLTAVLTPPNPDLNLMLTEANCVDSCTSAGSFQDGPSPTQDDSSDSTNYLSHISTVSECSLSLGHHREMSSGKFRQKQARLGRAALCFLHHFPFALHAVYSLLSGRTLVVLGSEEEAVKRWVRALTIFAPWPGRYRQGIQPWMSDPLQITDLLAWKLIGFNRLAFPTSPSIPLCLSRYSRYLSILDVDHRTLQCPAYRGSLICPVVESKIINGTTYFLHTQTVIGKVVAKAFLLSFSHGLCQSASPSESTRAERFRRHLHDDDMKVLLFLSELVRLRLMQTTPTVLRFSYTSSTLFKA